MATFRNVQMSFWTDSKVTDDFTPEDKYFYLYLFTNPHTNLCGCYEISLKQISYETGYSVETIERLIRRFVEIHKVLIYSKQTKEILLLNWHKYNWTKSEKFLCGLRKSIQSVKDDEFRGYLFDVEAEKDTVSIPYEYGMDTTVTDPLPDPYRDIYRDPNIDTDKDKDIDIDHEEHTDPKDLKDYKKNKDIQDHREPQEHKNSDIPEEKRQKQQEQGESAPKIKRGTAKSSVPKQPVYYPQDEQLNQAFADYVIMRKQLKKPMTDKAIELAMKKLAKISGGDNELAIRILEESIMNSWLGVFPLNDPNCKNNQQHQGQRSSPRTVFDEWRDA